MGAGSDSSESRLGGNGGGEEGVTVNIRCSNGTKFTVRANLESTVGSFKALLAQNCDVPADQQRLIYKGRILKDDQTLQSYGLQADHTIHMVRGFAPSSSTPPPSATTNVATDNTTPGVTRGIGSNDGAGLGASLFPGLNPLGGGGGSGGFGLFGSGLPEFEQVQQQLTQNPNMMREIMNTPAIQSLMNNPELMRSLIMSNPQMREIIDRNPELGHILNDPSILRQTLEAARNPELMREMMRNTDRAMSNIEASPEGFNMLRRMYENVQEPFLNATTMGGNNGNSPATNPFAALLGNQGGSEARSSPINTSTTGSETAQGQTSPNTNPLPNPWSNTAGGGGTQTNATARPNPAGDARTPGVGGMGGLGLPDLPPMLNGMPDASQLTQLLQNPAISQMMQSIMSNPQYMNQIMNLNPQLRGMFDMNPQLREMMQNPEVLRQMFSPETMQQMLALQQSLLSLNRQQSTPDSAQTGSTTGIEKKNLDYKEGMKITSSNRRGLSLLCFPTLPLPAILSYIFMFLPFIVFNFIFSGTGNCQSRLDDEYVWRSGRWWPWCPQPTRCSPGRTLCYTIITTPRNGFLRYTREYQSITSYCRKRPCCGRETSGKFRAVVTP